MAIVMVVIAGSTSNLCCLVIHERNNRVICDSAAFYAEVINDISESLFTHIRFNYSGVYQDLSRAARGGGVLSA